MPAKVPCPDEPSLQQLLLGRIPPPDCDILYDHLGACERCEKYAQTFRADDPLLDALRAPAPGGAEDPSVVRLIEALRRGGPPGPEGDDGDLRPTRMSDTVPPFDGADPRRELYDFLAPAQAAGELGRLGPYRVLKILGSGGMGVVFHAEDPALGRPVALKAMRPGLAGGASARRRFLREGRAAAAVLHDHVVPIYEVGDDRGVLYLAMPLLRGESLEACLHRERTLPLEEVCRVGREIALGLAAAHARGLIHRDVKPANVWLEADAEDAGSEAGEGRRGYGRVKILDFGLARPATDASLTREGAVVGTPAFMAPEQAGGGAVDARSDLFSLGCVLYRAATGELPFRGADAVATLLAVVGRDPRPPHDLRPDLPSALAELVLRLLAKKPEARPPSALAVVRAIRAVEQSPPRPRPARSSACRTPSWRAP